MTTSREQMERMRFEAERTEARLREEGREPAYGAQAGAENVKHGVASGLHTAAQRVREQGTERGQERWTSRVAQPLDRSAQYLDTHSLPEISQDASDYVREHPFVSAAGVFTAAFLFGRLLRRR